MLLWILLLIVVVIVFGLGFIVVEWLFYVAVVLFIVWLIVMLVSRRRA